MKLRTFKIKNFRGYRDEISIDFNNLTSFVGKNDVGKSTILEAMDIYFNDGKGIIKSDKNDANVFEVAAGNKEVILTALFEDIPDEVIIDSTNHTNLGAEYLLNSSGLLEVQKRFSVGTNGLGTPKIFIIANHPTNEKCSDLLSKSSKELKKIIEDENILCEDRTRNAVMRSAIWNHFADELELAISHVDVTKGDTKTIWTNLSTYLPIYSLFQSDRKNSDADSEVQDPLKQAVKEILNEENIIDALNEVANEVHRKLEEVANRTLDKLREMDPDVAQSLRPDIPDTENLKWSDVFKNVTITGDENIPINKRGSGVRRLILLNFFRAEAERRLEQINASNIIYAIEEPETSQHTNNQIKLIEALILLSEAPRTQVIITTHSPQIVKRLEYTNVRMVTLEHNVEMIQEGQLPYPSLNEVNFLAFNEISIEYHDELYGHIEYLDKLREYEDGKEKRPYRRLDNKTGKEKQEQRTLTHYIRDKVHHPENRLNPAFTDEELRQSIIMMRQFLDSLN